MVSTLLQIPFKIVLDSAQQTKSVSLAGGNGFFHNPDINQYFLPGDNINVLSVSLAFPSFISLLGSSEILDTSAINIMLIAETVSGVQSYFYDGYIPFSPYELAIGEFVDFSSFTEKFRLKATTVGLPKVVTGIIPPALDGLEIAIAIALKIEHNYNLELGL